MGCWFEQATGLDRPTAGSPARHLNHQEAQNLANGRLTLETPQISQWEPLAAMTLGNRRDLSS